MRARVKNCAESRRTIQAPNDGRTQDTMLGLDGRQSLEGRPEGEVGARQRQEDAESHRLAIVEAGVWWPARVVDVRLVPVGEKGTASVEEIS